MIDALPSDKEREPPNYYQIFIRLQAVRARVHELRYRANRLRPKIAEIDEILSGIQGIAVTAREAGLAGFTAACLHICEGIEPMLYTGAISRKTLELLIEWAANAELYLRRPQQPEFVRALVHQLSDPRWALPLTRVEREKLITILLQPPS